MRVRIGFLLFVAFSLVAEAQERSLHWAVLEVTARLDADGRLGITERHAMVLDGAWNGGERRFRVAPGQNFEFGGIARVENGIPRPLREGRASNLLLDRYAFFEPHLLRWRSRRPSDPPFRHRTLVYDISYALTGVVYRDGETFLLEHDFAFPERDGRIESFSLDLEIDPAWTLEEPLTSLLTADSLQPGESYVVSLRMKRASEVAPLFVQEGRPAAASAPPGNGAPGEEIGVLSFRTPPAPLPVRLGALALVLGLGWLGWRRFEKHERERGRFEPLPDVNRFWLDRNIFVHRPEVVGAAWDGATGSAEVAALIAVMSAEGKVETEEGAELRLHLKVPRESLSPYERGFVDRFFPAGDVTSPSILQARYARTGFDPAAAIRSALDYAARPLVGSGGSVASAIGCIAIGAVGAMVMASMMSQVVALFFGTRLGPIGPLMVLATVISVALAAAYNGMVDPRHTPWYVAVPVAGVAVVGAGLAQTLGALAFVLSVSAVIFFGALQKARVTRTAEQLQTLRAFHAARRYFVNLLDRNDPLLEPSWLPYLLAFGLAREVDRWSVVAPQRLPVRRSTDNSSSTGSSPSTAAFAAGGGGFGGAGASGGWASAVSAMASSIASPSSGSSGSSGGGSRSSGGGGGGRSGGGGGGGW